MILPTASSSGKQRTTSNNGQRNKSTARYFIEAIVGSENSELSENSENSEIAERDKKRGSRCLTSDSLLGGGYLRLPASLTIVVVTLRALFQDWEEEGHSRYDR